MHITDRLIEAIEAQNNPTVAGLDTRLEYIPEAFAKTFAPDGVWRFANAAEAILAYNLKLLEALRGLVPAVKVQVAYYEMYGVEGMRAFAETLRAAREMGFVTMADVKRNDIGATAQAYAMAYMGKTPMVEESAFSADYVTVNPYLGSDGIKPFLALCGEHGIFVLVKTSNPSSGELQDVAFGDGQTICERVGQLVSAWGSDIIGSHGYSAVGAVVGATYPEHGAALRKALPHTFFLVPGYGAQGATAAQLAGCFDSQGRGAIVHASRSLLLAWQKQNTQDFAQAAAQEALAMRTALREALKA